MFRDCLRAGATRVHRGETYFLKPRLICEDVVAPSFPQTAPAKDDFDYGEDISTTGRPEKLKILRPKLNKILEASLGLPHEFAALENMCKAGNRENHFLTISLHIYI